MRLDRWAEAWVLSGTYVAAKPSASLLHESDVYTHKGWGKANEVLRLCSSVNPIIVSARTICLCRVDRARSGVHQSRKPSTRKYPSVPSEEALWMNALIGNNGTVATVTVTSDR